MALLDFRQVMLPELQDRHSPIHERVDKLSKWMEVSLVFLSSSFLRNTFMS